MSYFADVRAGPSERLFIELLDAARATQCPKTRRRKLQSGTVTAVQRVNSDFRLNPHLHVLALDGVFVEQPDGSCPEFRQLPHLKSSEVADLVTTTRIRVLSLLIRRGVIEDSTEQLVLLPDGLAEDEPVLSQVTSAAASGLAPAGPERREREPLRVARSPGASITGALCAADLGHATSPPPTMSGCGQRAAAPLLSRDHRSARAPALRNPARRRSRRAEYSSSGVVRSIWMCCERSGALLGPDQTTGGCLNA